MQQLDPSQPLAATVRGTAEALLADALDVLDDRDVDVHERVHEARRAGKEVRGLLRLVRDAMPDRYAGANAQLRDAARLVGDARDTAAAVETFDALRDALGEEQLAPYADVREALVDRRDALPGDDLDDVLGEVRSRFAAARQGVAAWPLPDGAAVDVLRQGYGRTYGRARACLADAVDGPTTHAWHQWRKRAKYHRYHVDLLAAAWPPVMAQREDLLHDLTDLLGDDHDLAVLRSTLSSDRPDVDGALLDGFVGLLDRRRAALQRDALPLGRRLLLAEVDVHVDLVLGWWALRVDEEAACPEPVTEGVVPPGD